MHLKSLTLKGFKSFPDKTTLKFGPGTSVVVGPNGSGKSNITDAVLWVLGEQSPSAVRGRSMQDVIFSGGDGVQAKSSAEVELLLDNSDGTVPIDFPEISILRRLDRSGEGEYRLNGSRCRLIDVLELLSETGLGKEMHSVISQGRVEAIVTSKPRDRRLLIEEAAGLGKHRKRRHRAQLKLNRTRENLDRALDVEREARSRLKPLKRQAEAAELHARVERQTNETRWELQRDLVRSLAEELATAENDVEAARTARSTAESALAEVESQRQAAEDQLTEHGTAREQLLGKTYSVRSANERIAMRLERVRDALVRIDQIEREARDRLEQLTQKEASWPSLNGDTRIEEIESELAVLDRDRQTQIQRELSELEEQLERLRAVGATAEGELAAARERVETAEESLKQALDRLRQARVELDRARQLSAKTGGELAAVNQFLRSHGTRLGEGSSLADQLSVESGLEQALAAVLGRRLSAAIVTSINEGSRLLDQAGSEGGTTLVSRGGTVIEQREPPLSDAFRLIDRVTGTPEAVAIASRLLSDVWVVNDLAMIPEPFTGVAVTLSGRIYSGATGELRQNPEGSEERVLAERNRRDELIRASEAAASGERDAEIALEQAEQAQKTAAESLEVVRSDLRERQRTADEAVENVRRAEWTREQRREAPDEGPGAVRRAELNARLTALRDAQTRMAQEREEHVREKTRASEAIDRVVRVRPVALRLVDSLQTTAEIAKGSVTTFEQRLEEDRAQGDKIAAEMRRLAGVEAQRQSDLRAVSERVTHAEVAAQQRRDQVEEANAQLRELASVLGLEATPAESPLDSEQREQLDARLERLARRREQIGPVNPLAEQEYKDALAHVEELERQRTDLEGAIRELDELIKETDRHIRETFEATFAATAKNFEEVVQHLFPGGKGLLSLVKEDSAPRQVVGDQPVDETEIDDLEDEELEEKDELIGLEIEVTPAGKKMKGLSLLSGGEKSLTALAFLFAVFITRPCPFYIMDEVEAALDDLNTGRFLDLLDRYRDRAQFIVVTHQKRTMEAADYLYGVSMAANGISKVISRKLPRDEVPDQTELLSQPA